MNSEYQDYIDDRATEYIEGFIKSAYTGEKYVDKAKDYGKKYINQVKTIPDEIKKTYKTIRTALKDRRKGVAAEKKTKSLIKARAERKQKRRGVFNKAMSKLKTDQRKIPKRIYGDYNPKSDKVVNPLWRDMREKAYNRPQAVKRRETAAKKKRLAIEKRLANRKNLNRKNFKSFLYSQRSA